MSDHVIESRLYWNISQAQSASRQMQASMGGLQSSLNAIRNSMLVIGASRAFSAASRGMASFVQSAAEVNSRMEQSKIGIASMVAAADEISFANAQQSAETLFTMMQSEAAKTHGEVNDLMDIFQQSIHPARALGMSYGDIVGMTGQVANLGAMHTISFPQMGNDMREMLSGRVASMSQNKVFKNLIPFMGDGTMDTKGFNALGADERLAAIKAALTKAVPPEAAQLIANSFGSQLNAFKSHANIMKQNVFGEGFFNEIKRVLTALNTLMESRKFIDASRALGAMFRGVIAPIVDRMVAGITNFAANWETNVPKMLSFAQSFLTATRVFLKGAVIYAAAQAAGAIGGVASGYAGAAAGAAGGYAGALGAMFSSTSLMTALAAGAAALAVVLGLVIGLVSIVTSHWQLFMAAMDPILTIVMQLGASLWGLISNIWELIRPFFELAAAPVLFIVGAALILALATVRTVLEAWRTVFSALLELTAGFRTSISNAIDWILQKLRMFGDIFAGNGPAGTPGGPQVWAQSYAERLEAEAKRRRTELQDKNERKTAPGDREGRNFDFRGSRITMNQDFANANPDNIMSIISEDINRQAVMRIQSNYSGAMG